MSNELDIRNLVFHKNEYTNCFLISCIKYTWKFVLNKNLHIIYLFNTKLFGKRRIILDNKEIYNKSVFTCNFTISFPVEFYNITISQKETFYILKINGISFSKILNDLKLQKFIILENDYKAKQEEKKKRAIQKRKNKILLNAIKNFGKKENDTYEINLNDDEDDKTIDQSFELNEKDLDIINKYINDNNDINKNESNKFENRKKEKNNIKKFKPNEKINHNDYSFNNMIDNDVFGHNSIISGDIESTNFNRSYHESTSKRNKDQKNG